MTRDFPGILTISERKDRYTQRTTIAHMQDKKVGQINQFYQHYFADMY